MKTEIKAIAIIAGALALGYIAKVTQAGQGIQEFLGGIGKGIGELLSPQIKPSFEPTIKIVPEFGINICIPVLGLPCTVSSRDTGVTPGSGSASAGFQPIPLAAATHLVGGTPIPYPQLGWEQYVGWTPV